MPSCKGVKISQEICFTLRYFLNDFTYGDRIPSSARPHQRRRNKRRRKPTKKKTARKIIYLPAYYNLKAEDTATGGGDVIWNSDGGRRYFWDETAHKIVWDHPIPRRRPSYVTPQPSLVKKVTWDHPIPLNTDPPPPDDTTVWKHPRRMMLYYKT